VQCLTALKDDARFDIECFFDNSPAKWGTTLEGLEIRQPTREAIETLDAVILASVYAREILAQLTQLGCSSRVALSPVDLARRFTAGSATLRVDDSLDPAAINRLREALIAGTPAHVRALANDLDADLERAPITGTVWADETACTICCNNYFAYALVLARSFLRHHPGGRFFIGLADRRSTQLAYPSDPRIRIIAADELGIPAFDAFAFKYDILEFNTAIKPYLLEYVFRREGVRRLLYLDPDILVLDSLMPLFDRLSNVPMVLTPHLTRPYTDDRHPQEVDIMRSGTFNLGFIGLAAHEQTWAFLSWWQQRLYNNGCTREVEKGYFTDQKWIDFVPSFFPLHTVLREPGYNAAYWNLHERTITERDGRFLANGEPLRFFHFSGVDVQDLDGVSKHQNRHALPSSGALRDLFEVYRLLLLRHGHLTLRSIRYAYSSFDNGVRVPDLVRTIYREAALTGVYPHPFMTTAQSSFYDWLRAPARPNLPVTNLLASIHARTADVRIAYPDLYGGNLVGFLLYMLSASELYGLPAELAGSRFDSPTPAAAASDSGSPPARTDAVRAVVDPGDDVSAIMSQSLATAVHEAASRARVRSELLIGPVRAGLPARARPVDSSSGVAYWCWNEQWDREAVRAACQPDRRSDQTGPREIWVPSTYALEGLARVATVPVVKVPPPVGVIQPSSSTRARLGLPEDRFLFAAIVGSPAPGGGVEAALRLVRAFSIASQDQHFASSASLALSVTPALATPDLRRALEHAGMESVHLIGGDLSAADRVQLVRLADAYISLEASQAFDLWLAYASWHGTSTIAAAHGGGADCATLNNSFLVDVEDRASEYEAGHGSVQVADVEHAAAQMRHVLRAPEEAARRAARGRDDARARYALGVVAETIHGRLERLGAIAAAS
jgi:hypothetical protein